MRKFVGLLTAVVGVALVPMAAALVTTPAVSSAQ
jgi:hypothetical protein